MILQKLIGIALVALGILVPVVSGDATASLLLVPAGTYTIFTKKRWVR